MKRPGEDVILELKDVKIHFDMDEGLLKAVDGVDFTIRKGRTLGIVGESGCGKSVTTNAIFKILPKYGLIDGDIWLYEKDGKVLDEPINIAKLNPTGDVIRSIRGGNISMIFQDPMTALNPVYTVGDQLAEAMRSHEAVSKKIALARAADMLDLVGIPRPKERLGAYPHEFSGGMRQRVMIAMAIINNPDVIIADEPTTALDVTVQAQILEKLIEVKDAVNAAIVLITHDLGVVAGLADRALVMYAGRAVEIGETMEVFHEPRMPYTAGLLGSIPSLDSDGGRLRPIPGAPPSLINLPPGCPFASRCPLVRADCHESEPALGATDRPGHRAACHHWDVVADSEDPTAFFRPREDLLR